MGIHGRDILVPLRSFVNHLPVEEEDCLHGSSPQLPGMFCNEERRQLKIQASTNKSKAPIVTSGLQVAFYITSYILVIHGHKEGN